MLTNTDRFASRACRHLPPLYEPFRLPIDPTRSASPCNPVARHAWIIVAYPIGQSATNSPGLAHCVIIRRLADGAERTLAQHHIARALDL